MYLVTFEDEDGMWFDDPIGCDTLPEARTHMNNAKVKGAAVVCIYECRQVDYREMDAE